MKRSVPLDELDYRLLDLVQRDAKRPLHELGDEVGLSPSAVQRRLTRLTEAGVIRSTVAVVEPRAVGADLLAVVLVALTDDDPDHHASFRRRMQDEPAVQQCYTIVGQWDYVVVVLTRGIEENRELSYRLFVDGGAVARYETLPAFETVKAGLTVPLGEGPGR
ncbi:Lrp/AsnC family transcriptional regulator [Phytoactinopolyspora halotolerans]|uniref:Lrp/AsnC family transcriptional regulator n=1 Tax=Phytoactinopolyspora halotolerans TaxID=1981512 RepID=A0A6L9SBF7_9ACTN|nr:Lrp/AsnC family transcriptional regulator [Phytoactinopolyspora halotolerans]NEE01974.1 Lrp/AsnC family transcriptional regulator [Phytoactinopolyspora halotolerans]